MRTSLITFLLCLAGFSAAAEKVPKLVREIDELRDHGKVAEAIAAYRQLITEHRRELRFTAPALVHLVAAYQLAKDDEKAKAEYEDLAARWLSAVPPLDGASELPLVQAEEDLLWKPWDPKRSEPAFSFTFVQCNRGISLTPTGRFESVAWTFEGKSPDLGFLLAGEESNSKQAKPILWKGDGDDAASYDLTKGCSVTGIDGSAVTVWLTAGNLPSTVKKFAKVTGNLALCQRKYDRLIRTPFERGAKFKAGKNLIGTIRQSSIEGDSFHLQIVLGFGSDKEVVQQADLNESEEPAASNDEAARTLSIMPYAIIDESGKPCQPTGGGSNSVGNQTVIDWTYSSSAAKPAYVLWRPLEMFSKREIPVTIENLEVP